MRRGLFVSCVLLVLLGALLAVGVATRAPARAFSTAAVDPYVTAPVVLHNGDGEVMATFNATGRVRVFYTGLDHFTSGNWYGYIEHPAPLGRIYFCPNAFYSTTYLMHTVTEIYLISTTHIPSYCNNY